MQVMSRLHRDQVAALLSGQEGVRIGCDSSGQFQGLFTGVDGRRPRLTLRRPGCLKAPSTLVLPLGLR